MYAQAQITITDFNDFTPSATAPVKPYKGQMWQDTSQTPPVLKTWDGTLWITANDYEIGGRSILLDSGRAVTSAVYLIKSYDCSVQLKPNTDYTIVTNCTCNEGNKISFWLNGGYAQVGYCEESTKIKDDIYVVHFTSPKELTTNTLRVYNSPRDTAQTATINWVCLYEGNVKPPLQWVQNPDDMVVVVETVKTNSTNLSAANGKIQTLITENTVRKGETTTLNTKYSQVLQTVESLGVTIGSVTSKANANEAQITDVKNRQTAFEASLDGITSTVSETEQLLGETATTVAGLSSTISQQSDNWTAAFQVIGAEGYTKTGKTTIDANGLTIYDGALKVKNAAGTDVLKANSNGYLDLAGTFTQYAENGNKSVEIKDNSVNVYAFGEKSDGFNSGQYLGGLKPQYFKRQNLPIDYALKLYSEYSLIVGSDDKEDAARIVILNIPAGASWGGNVAPSGIEIYAHSLDIEADEIFFNGSASDLIASQYKSGIWTYRKWLSGISECWGLYDLRVTSWTAWGNIYESNQVPRVYFPPKLFSGGITNYQVSAVQGVRMDSKENATMGVELYSDYSLDHTGQISVLRATPDDGKGTYEIHYYIKGRWK